MIKHWYPLSALNQVNFHNKRDNCIYYSVFIKKEFSTMLIVIVGYNDVAVFSHTCNRLSNTFKEWKKR